jgi:hypothetical protein
MLKNHILTVEKSHLSSKYKKNIGGPEMFKNTTQTSRLNTPDGLSWNKTGAKNAEEISLWNQILFQFRALPKERQDEILLRIYRKLYGNTARAKSFSFISSGKC